MKSYSEIIKTAKHPAPPTIDISKVITEQRHLPLSIVKKGIKQGQLKINSKPFYFHEILLKDNTIITFQNITIDVEEFRRNNEFDFYVNLILLELKETSVSDLNSFSRKAFAYYLIAYFANNSLDLVIAKGSTYLDAVVIELENFYREYFKNSKDSRTPRRKELVDTLIHDRQECLTELSGLIINLKDGVFQNSLYKFLQEYTRIINKNGFQNIVAPVLSTSLYSRIAIDALIKPITEAKTKKDINERFVHFDSNKNIYENYLSLIDNLNGLHTEIFNKIGNYLFEIFKKECDTADVKPADLHIKPTSKKYNFNNRERTEYDLSLNIKNSGDGLARDVKINSESEILQFDEYNVGILKPEDSRDISIIATIIKTFQNPSFRLRCNWVDVTGAKKEKIVKITFGVQNANIPWNELEKRKPYTIQEIEDKEKLYGRDEILKELEQNILSDIIESYKIWGQKRVGKSSIVKTLKSLFNNKEKIVVVWRSIAGLKNIDPILTLNTLGESICSEIFEELDRKITNLGIKELLKSIPVPEFHGSLSPLELYIKKLRRIDTEIRFVFIIDEFDRINEEFFLPGNLGDSFSLNIGKGLNSLTYVSFILVGSENMHLLDRQEMNYNNFQNREVDTFDKQREFGSFRKIIVGPVTPYIHYTDESIEKIYDVTNGNPYLRI